MDNFLGYHNIGLYLGVISMHFRVFFKVKVQNGKYFLVAKISIFWGCLKFLTFFGVNGRCWPEPTYEESTPPRTVAWQPLTRAHSWEFVTLPLRYRLESY